ncbi:MAG: hypothetical protein ACE5GV_09940 [Candidatus Scalindua sp.]
MEMLKDYFALQKKIYSYFGYVEDWEVIPLEDATDYFWALDKDFRSGVHFAKNQEDVLNGYGYYNEIYYQRFLPKWIYETKDYTMVCVDPRCDGNKFLQIFDNSKRVPGFAAPYL